jgi:exopolysaccharide production protein ExoZ
MLLVVTSGIVVALGLLLNIVVEQPLLRFSRRLSPKFRLA